jgi:non-specific serine/threonine protein kinase
MFDAIGDYKILDRIGAGGLGEVYRARDTRLGRTVAIKVLAPTLADNPDRRDRVRAEARTAAVLSHPNIAALYEIAEDQGRLFLVFEFVPGESLTTVISGRPLHPRRAIDLAVQLADALADAHAAGIVHRDIKPGSIIVTPRGNAKILDFGLATWTAGGANREHASLEMRGEMRGEMTGRPSGAGPVSIVGGVGPVGSAVPVGSVLGTVAYMSPEQALGEQQDHRTDVFSLGIVLFEMLTGTLPFPGTTTAALALQIVQAPAPAPSAINGAVPRDLDAIVAKALAKSLDQRYESAATMAAELRAVAAMLDARSATSEPAPAPIAIRPARRSYAAWVVFILVLAALAAGAWWQRASIERVWRRTLAAGAADACASLSNDATRVGPPYRPDQRRPPDARPVALPRAADAGERHASRRMSPSRIVKADRAMTSSIPA